MFCFIGRVYWPEPNSYQEFLFFLDWQRQLDYTFICNFQVMFLEPISHHPIFLLFPAGFIQLIR